MFNDGGSITSCKRLAAESESGVVQQYYALVLTNAQQQTFDLAVTDGQHAWRGTGKLAPQQQHLPLYAHAPATRSQNTPRACSPSNATGPHSYPHPLLPSQA